MKNAELFRNGQSKAEVLKETWVEQFNVHARPGATTIIKENNPLLLKACALDPIS
jgi:hypothetical protein